MATFLALGLNAASLNVDSTVNEIKIKDYTIEKIIFLGQIKIFKEIEKYYEMNYTEVKIIWL